MTEDERKAIFRDSPMVLGFLSTLLQDAQHHESDEACEAEREARDSGTVYDCPDSTFRAVVAECEAFLAACEERAKRSILLTATLEDLDTLAESVGSDLYLERYGHGAGFRDRSFWSDDRDENRRIGELLSECVDSRGSLETYLGDDGQCYICGKESA